MRFKTKKATAAQKPSFREINERGLYGRVFFSISDPDMEFTSPGKPAGSISIMEENVRSTLEQYKTTKDYSPTYNRGILSTMNSD